MSIATDTTIYRDRDFQVFAGVRFLVTIAMNVQSIAIGLLIVSLTHSPLALGIVGLCQFGPMFLLTLPAGDLADRLPQRRLLSATQAMQSVCAALFLLLVLFERNTIWPYYVVLVLFGCTRGFYGATSQSLLPFLVAPEKLPRAIALSSSVFTTATIAGPALGGFLYALGPVVTFSISVVLMVIASLLTATLGGRRRPA